MAATTHHLVFPRLSATFSSLPLIKRDANPDFLDKMLGKLPPSVIDVGATLLSGDSAAIVPMLASGVSSMTGANPATVTSNLNKAKSMLGFRKRAPQQKAAAAAGNTQKGAGPATTKPATTGNSGGSTAGATGVGKADPNLSLPTAGAPIRPKVDPAFSEPDGQAPIIPKSVNGGGTAAQAVDGNAQAMSATNTVLPAGAVKAGDSVVRAAGGLAGSKAGVAAPAAGLVPIVPTP